MTIQAYQFAGGYGIVAIPNATIISSRDPTTTDTISPDGNPYTPGQYWRNNTTGNLFVYIGGGVWDPVSGSGITAVTTLTGDSGGAVSPTAGNINLLGTANEITTTGTPASHQIVFSIPAVFIAPGSIASTTTITSGTSMSSTTTITAGTGITSTTGNIVATAGAVNAGTTMTAGTGITATTGNIVASAGAVTATNTGTNRAFVGDTTGGTGVTATLASSGATVDALQLTGGSIKVPATTNTPGASPQTVNARTGRVAFTDVIANAAFGTLTLTNSLISSSSVIIASVSCTTVNSALQIVEITPGAGSVALRIFNAGSASTAANILVNFWVLN